MDRTLLINNNWNIIYSILCSFIIRKKHLKHTFMIVKIYRFTTTYVLLQSTWATAQQFPWYVFDSFTYAQYAPTNEITMRGFKPSGFFIFLFFHVLFFILSLCLWFKENNKQPMSKVTITPPPRPGYSFRVTPRKPLDTDLFCFFLFSLSFFSFSLMNE